MPGTCTGSIGDVAFHDLNSDGLQNSGEPGIDGLQVRLRDSNNVVRTTFTGLGPANQHGYYQFPGLCLGTYTVEIDTPVGFAPTNSLVGADRTIDSNGSPTSVTLQSNNTSDQTVDFGFVALCSASLGNYVWTDADRNGRQDPSEQGIDGVRVWLKSPGGTIIQTTMTMNGGAYGFTGLCAQTYRVEVDPTTLPPGYTPTISNAPGTNAANDSNGSPALVTLPAFNANDDTIDFGYQPPCTGSIGNFVWHDQNQNGIQDGFEPGLNGVVVKLFDLGMNQIQMDSTVNGGQYIFLSRAFARARTSSRWTPPPCRRATRPPR
ncbi:MAG: hypothetical protein FJW40_04310 [Acidobacteria bacterium]|nr:hypothetical protein [Acidobacteriota bacterium]